MLPQAQRRSLWQLKDRTQAVIDGILQSSRKRSHGFSQDTGERELADLSGRSQQHVTRGIGKLQVAGDCCHDCRLDATAVEGIS
jgi:hypothetical protein